MGSYTDEKRLNVRKLLIAILKITRSGWIPASYFDRMAREFGIPHGRPLIFFLNGLIQITREIPLKVFSDIASRTALLESLQGALDEAIEKEEMSTCNEPENDSQKIWTGQSKS